MYTMLYNLAEFFFFRNSKRAPHLSSNDSSASYFSFFVNIAQSEAIGIIINAQNKLNIEIKNPKISPLRVKSFVNMFKAE